MYAQAPSAQTPPSQNQATQTQPPSPEQPPQWGDFAISYFGSFPSAAVGNGVHQGATSSGGALATFRWLISAHHGLELDYGYTRDTEQYLRFDASNAVHTDAEEGSASYVFRATVGRATPFLTAGAAALVFDPLHSGTITPTPAGTQARAAFVYGAGLDIALTKHITLRQEYRGFVLRAPDFGTGVGSDAPMYVSEMLAGFVWKL
jgi:outer membrane immunogenic protein